MIPFGSSISPFVRKVLAFAAEKGIDLENRPTGLQSNDEEFIRVSPFRKIPALADGDFSLADSSAIVHYLEALHPDPNLIPTDPQGRGRVVWFDEWADTILFGCGQKMFFNRVVAPRFLKRPGDLEAADRAERDELPPILDYLEAQIPESGFLVEDRLTLADIAVASVFVNFAHLKLSLEASPRTARYIAAIHARPSFAPIIAKESRLFEPAPS